ncbi:MAG: LysR substrate-binding domain-containing protein [Propionivibrio sp.]
MELRQLRYFVRVVELGGMGRAAAELGLGTSALSQQISRLEGELAARLLRRTATGVVPTEAGLAFLPQAQLALRHVDEAARAAREARLSGQVSVGMPPSTASILGVPFLTEMRARYPAIQVRLVEALSGNLSTLVDRRQLDLAILFQAERARRWSVRPLLEETLFLIAPSGLPGLPRGASVRLAAVAGLPLILPSAQHGLRALVDAAAVQAGVALDVVAEIDGLALLMDAVRAGLGATVQPGAAAVREPGGHLRCIELTDALARRPNLMVSLSDEELSPAGLAARVVLEQVARQRVDAGVWPGARLYKN